jgi:hypothetical protein
MKDILVLIFVQEMGQVTWLPIHYIKKMQATTADEGYSFADIRSGNGPGNLASHSLY